jgi:L-cysteine desulfidase
MALTIKELLRLEVVPALGCTEPVAVSLGAAAAVSLLPERQFDSIDVWVDPNVFKNSAAVGIPGTDGINGLDMAAALGAIAGDPARGLEVLAPVEPAHVRRARSVVEAGHTKVNMLDDAVGLNIMIVAFAGKRTGKAVIRGQHDNLVELFLDGESVAEHPLLSRSREQGPDRVAEIEEWLKSLSFEALFSLVDDLDDEDLAFMKIGVENNFALAEYGLDKGSGLAVGRTIKELVEKGLMKEDMVVSARILTAAAADARMSGAKLAAMSSSGSGNQGLTAVLPLKAVRDAVGADERVFLKAVAISHTVTAYIKAHTGRLSALCGCSIAAGAGATAGVTYILGGGVEQAAGAIKNQIGDLAGVICDGAKCGCALKLATAAGNAVQSALFSMEGLSVDDTDGIIGVSLEQTTQNVGALSHQGMIEADRTILKIMLDKQFSRY